jgi:hypothetical protein
MDEWLLILSRHGWDRAGEHGKLLRFRHAGTGEETEIAPGEIPFWAAQMEPEAIPTTGGDWYAERIFLDRGLVRSRAGTRQTGITHNRRGEILFMAYADAERAAAVLNARDEGTQLVLF